MTLEPAPFDRSIVETNAWLRDVEARLDVSRRHAYAGLRATLLALRDRLPAKTALRFADQLPARLRGVFMDGWVLADRPAANGSAAAFADQIARGLPPGFPFDAETVVRAAFLTVYDQMDGREVDTVVRYLPPHVREVWLEDVG